MKHRYFVLGFFILIIICMGFCIFASVSHQGGIAQIYSDGQLLYEIDLNHIEEPYELIVEHNGNHNKVYVEKGKISVIDADCPDGLCIKQGYGGKHPIVCLPNKLVIKIISSKDFGIPENSDKPDAVSN